MAPHKSFEHIELHMRIFFKDNTKMQLLTDSFFDSLTRTEIASIYGMVEDSSRRKDGDDGARIGAKEKEG